MNIIDAVISLIKKPVFELKEEYVNYTNRANSMGDALEQYVFDLFAGTFNTIDEQERLEKISETFSYIGNNSNPPDAMLKDGDAIEVKKIESIGSQLQLNSSYPKNKLRVDNEMLTLTARNAEPNWTEKDLLYIIGHVTKNTLNSLFFVYGEDYAADIGVYSNLKKSLQEEIASIPNVEFSKTRELGRINSVDPLGITDLRIRGMWLLQNPFKSFRYLTNDTNIYDFTAYILINETKWKSFNNTDELLELIESSKIAQIQNIKIKNSNNPANLKDAKLIIVGVNKEEIL